MTHSRVDHLWTTCCGAVPLAVAVGTQERAALDDPARNPELGLAGGVARLDLWAARGARGAGRGRGGAGVVSGRVPVGGPLPDVAGDVVQTVGVGGEGPALARVPVPRIRPPREVTVPVVGQP